MNKPQFTKPESSKPIYIILIIAFSVRLGWILYTPALPISDFQSYNNLAHTIANGGSISSSYRVPGYSVFLAILYTSIGDYLLVPLIANAILGTLTTLFTYLIAKISFNRSLALIAAGMMALLPSHILYAGLLASENLFTPLLLAGAVCYLYAVASRQTKWWLLFVSGILLGLAALVRPVALFLPGTWFLFLLWKRYSFWRAIVISIIVTGVTVITFSPWLVYNYSQSGKLTLQTNGGFNLLMGAHEKANGYYVPEILHEINAEAKEKGLDEFERDALAYQYAIQFIHEHPIRWVALTPLRWFHLFKHDVSGVVWNFKNPSRPYPQVLWYLLVLVGQSYYMVMIGLVLIGFFYSKKPYVKHRGYGFPLATLFLWLAFHAISIGVDRFHLPLLPFLSMFSSLGLLVLLKRFERNKKMG